MKIRSTFMVLIAAMVLSGCYGSGAMWNVNPGPKVYDEEALKAVHRLCVMPVIVMVDETHAIYTKSLTDSIWNQFNAERLFSLIPTDSLVEVMKSMPGSDTVRHQAVARQLHADAYIKVGIAYSHSPGPAKEPSALCVLSLIDANTDEVLLECGFDTYLGKNYWGPPKLEQVTNDAIRGAVQSCAKAIRNNRQLSSR